MSGSVTEVIYVSLKEEKRQRWGGHPGSFLRRRKSGGGGVCARDILPEWSPFPLTGMGDGMKG